MKISSKEHARYCYTSVDVWDSSKEVGFCEVLQLIFYCQKKKKKKKIVKFMVH